MQACSWKQNIHDNESNMQIIIIIIIISYFITRPRLDVMEYDYYSFGSGAALAYSSVCLRCDVAAEAPTAATIARVS